MEGSQRMKKVDEGEAGEMCDMRGMLSFTILWLLSRRPMYGQELATEIGNLRGDKPNPGTIYPALKELAARRLIESSLKGRSPVYELTQEGRSALGRSMAYFERAFGDIFDEIRAASPGPAKSTSGTNKRKRVAR